MEKRRKFFVFILIDLAIILILIGYFGFIWPRYHQVIEINGIFIAKPKEVTDFRLIDNSGNSFSKQNLKGKWTFFYFGFTQCPSVCPTTLATLNQMYVKLQRELPAKKLPQVVFITVDPEDDSITKLNSYVHSFNSHFIGARGDVSETDAIAKQFAISINKINKTIDHSTDVILVNPAMQIQAYFTYPQKAELLVSDYKKIVNQP